jgi:hypothetical protein
MREAANLTNRMSASQRRELHSLLSPRIRKIFWIDGSLLP